MFSSYQRLANQKGQSLLEIAISLGIAVMIILALSITTIQGLQSSQFSQNQVQATKFAQEGLELIKSFKNNNTPVCIGATEYYWTQTSDSPPLVWSTVFNGSATIYNLLPSVPAGLKCLLATANAGNADLPLGRFERQVFIEDDSTSNNLKKVTVVVTWRDYAGTHESRVATILSDY